MRCARLIRFNTDRLASKPLDRMDCFCPTHLSACGNPLPLSETFGTHEGHSQPKAAS